MMRAEGIQVPLLFLRDEYFWLKKGAEQGTRRLDQLLWMESA